MLYLASPFFVGFVTVFSSILPLLSMRAAIIFLLLETLANNFWAWAGPSRQRTAWRVHYLSAFEEDRNRCCETSSFGRGPTPALSGPELVHSRPFDGIGRLEKEQSRKEDRSQRKSWTSHQTSCRQFPPWSFSKGHRMPTSCCWRSPQQVVSRPWSSGREQGHQSDMPA